MSNSHPDWLDEYPPAVRETLDAALRVELDAPIVLTRLFLALADIGKISRLLGRAETERQEADDHEGAHRLRAVRDLASGGRASLDKMRDVLAILHGGSPQQTSASPSSIAAAFDAAVEISPAASVALYSLGDSALLGGATHELISLLRTHRLISRSARVLEVGCGIGRFAQALAPEVASFTGIDVSKNMIRVARERCANLPNVTLAVTSGDDLGQCADRSFDLVLAVDSFPYIVATRPGLAETQIGESARVLAEGGSLAIFNFAYDEDFGTSRERLRHAGEKAGLSLIATDAHPLRSWDGSFFRLLKQSLT
jgi:SAM-dependent methyltransferase